MNEGVWNVVENKNCHKKDNEPVFKLERKAVKLDYRVVGDCHKTHGIIHKVDTKQFLQMIHPDYAYCKVLALSNGDKFKWHRLIKSGEDIVFNQGVEDISVYVSPNSFKSNENVKATKHNVSFLNAIFVELHIDDASYYFQSIWEKLSLEVFSKGILKYPNIVTADDNNMQLYWLIDTIDLHNCDDYIGLSVKEHFKMLTSKACDSYYRDYIINKYTNILNNYTNKLFNYGSDVKCKDILRLVKIPINSGNSYDNKCEVVMYDTSIRYNLTDMYEIVTNRIEAIHKGMCHDKLLKPVKIYDKCVEDIIKLIQMRKYKVYDYDIEIMIILASLYYEKYLESQSQVSIEMFIRGVLNKLYTIKDSLNNKGKKHRLSDNTEIAEIVDYVISNKITFSLEDIVKILSISEYEQYRMSELHLHREAYSCSNFVLVFRDIVNNTDYLDLSDIEKSIDRYSLGKIRLAVDAYTIIANKHIDEVEAIRCVADYLNIGQTTVIDYMLMCRICLSEMKQKSNLKGIAEMINKDIKFTSALCCSLEKLIINNR